MKKTVSALLAVLALLFLMTSCGSSKDNAERAQVIGFYSVHSTPNDFMVHFDSKVGAYEELYDENDVHIKLKSGAKILDAQGNEIKASDLKIGDALIITYDGTVAKDNPKTVNAFEIQKQF